jgi:YidC/Oxa1 family membrane protein insertase
MNQFSSTAMGKMMLYGLPASTFLFMAWWPSALQLYFATTGLFALGQSYLLNSPGFRRWAGVAPLPTGPQLIPGGGPSGQGSEGDRRIRLLEDYIKAEAKKAGREQFKASPTAALKNPVSFIDKVVDSVKANMSKVQKEMSEKVNEVAGQAPTINADGTPAPPPRLSKSDLQRAESYQKRREEEEEYKREERNHARREAYLRALEEQKEKAARSFRSTKVKTR